ncbi:molybdopterin-dependent oxidoreductase [Humibacillus xanthopallidus]|uniref:DMSO/TMAO reductase YedYZ molybdopterin-dependent catalytic subunit n=1 Tax=Humibacillus xanthopallidus TaxID=412689 RepID=A0A543I3C8_9MICO|nr:molybdopterin-dependent oxidoreductase [Humibacillus xanthopallidus]TQM65104.1 DMSO/TMAO reductase YedYZ molybdopterin-dependent catalytic subunit [Humibacillus xanthopallidus]
MIRIRLALSGILAAVAGIAVGHLVAGFVDPATSPVLTVSSTVIDLTPTPVKEWAVARFGTADKAILLGSVVLVTLVAAGVIGLLARHRRTLATALLGVLVLATVAAAVTRPAFAAVDVLPSLATLVVGLAAFWWLTGLALAADPEGEHGAARPARVGTARREFIGGALGVATLSVLAAVGGQLRAGAQAARRLVLPRPADPAPAFPAGLEATVPGITPLRTPNDTFYRVDTNLAVPRVDVDRWTLEVDGMVERPFSLTFDELAAMPLIERDITMTCVSNEVGGGYVGAARWLGVRLSDVLDRAGITGAPDQVLSTAVDGFTISTPLDVVRDGRDAMIAIGMNGTQLPEAHGFPARLITPGLYGFVGATKWLTKLTLTTYAAEQAYWTRRQWATDAPIKTSARVDTPRPLSTIAAGRTAIGGVAWAQHRGVGKVEVRIDGGDWQQTELGPDVGIDYWRQWYLPWDAKPGLHRIAVRAVDRSGRPQLSERATPFPSGSSGIQEVVVTVE